MRFAFDLVFSCELTTFTAALRLLVMQQKKRERCRSSMQALL